MNKEDKVKPVEWTKDGYPIFTDQFQFYRWERERRKEIAEEIKDIVDERAIEIAVKNSLKDFMHFVETMKLAIEWLERKTIPSEKEIISDNFDNNDL